MGPVNFARLRQLVRKELRQMFRDPRSRRMLFLAPVVQLLLFGYAVNTDVRNVRTFVVDHDRSAESRELVSAVTASGYFRVTGQSDRAADILSALDHGEAVLGLEIPSHFAVDLNAGRPTKVQVLIDGTSANTANVAQAYATQIIQRFGLRKINGPPEADGALPGVDLRARAWYNPSLESRVYNVPGVMGTIVMMMGLLLTSLAVVRERELGTLEQLMVSPLKPAELILGKTLPPVLVGFVQLCIITAVALLWFGVPLRGSFLLLLLAAFCYILSGLGIGLFISTVSQTQQEAFMSMFFFFLPAIILSGFLYPVENMPRFFQYVSLMDPIRHFLVVVRGVFLKGAGMQVLWPQIAALLAIGISVLTFAMTRFHKTGA